MSNIASTTVKKTISIPFKIKRSPTDLLKALSQSVGLDPNGPHYSLIDDSILTPLNPTEAKRNYLAKASGIKAAKFMIEKYPQAFMKDICEPHVPKFFPQKEFTEEELKYPSEDLIYSLMSWGKFKQAYDTYLKCKDQSIDVSEGCKLVMLDLLSINNNSDLKERSPVLEEWHLKGTQRDLESKSRYTPKNTWIGNGEAEQIFNELKLKSAEAYCSLIKGMAKYNAVDNANKLYIELKTNKLVPDLNTINALLKLIIYINDASNEKKTELMMDKLNDIKNYGIMPNLITFNTCFEIIKSFNLYQKSIPLALDLFKEMELLKIEPSLATFSHVISIFYPQRDIGSKTKVLEQIINQVEKMSENGLEWRDINDSTFFKVAMEKCFTGNDNLLLAKRLHAILSKNNNIKFLNDNHLYNKYFESYLLALMKFDLPENVIKEWRNLTPYIFNRSIRIFERMLDYVYEYKCFDFVPEIWSSLIEFKIKRLTDFCTYAIRQLLQTMVQYDESNQELIKQYASIAETMIKSYPYFIEKLPFDEENEQTNLAKEYDWDAKMLSNFFKVILKANNFELAWSEFEKYVSNQVKIAGELNEKVVEELFNCFNNQNQLERAFYVLKFAVSLQLPVVKDIIKTCEKNQSLNHDQKVLLIQLKQKLNLI